MNKNLILRRLGAATLSLSILAGGFLPSLSYASERDMANGVSAQEVELKTDISTFTISDILTKATVKITGNLSGNNPIIGKPYAEAKTSTDKTVYSIRAKADSNNNGTGTSTTGWKMLNNTMMANSGRVTSTTSKVTFTGFHQAKISSTSNWVSTKNTRVSY